MNFKRFSAVWITRTEQMRVALAQLPVQARSVLIGAVLIVTALTLLSLSHILGGGSVMWPTSVLPNQESVDC